MNSTSSASRSDSSRSSSASRANSERVSSASNTSSASSAQDVDSGARAGTSEPADSVTLSEETAETTAEVDRADALAEALTSSMESTPPDPSTPEYGESLIDGIAETSPELANGLRPESARHLSEEETAELLDFVSSSPELGGLDAFAKSLTEENNGYLTGPDVDTLASRFASSVVEGMAENPDQLSQATVDNLIDLSPEFGWAYEDAKTRFEQEQPPSDQAFEEQLDLLGGADSVMGQTSGRGPDSPIDHTFTGPVGSGTARTDLNGFNPLFGELQPGVTQISDGKVSFIDGSQQRTLSPEQLEDFAAEAMSLAKESQDQSAIDLAQRSLAVLGGAGGTAGAQKVADVYDALGLAVPDYLAEAIRD